MLLYRIHTKSLAEAEDAWYEQYHIAHDCPGCPRMDRRLRQTGVDVRLADRPEPAAVNAVSRTEIQFARKDFLDLFASEVDAWLKLGRVLGPDGKPYDEYATFIAEKPLVLRGGPASTRRTCEVCGCFRYLPMPHTDWHVTTDSLTGQPIYECEYHGMIVTEELHARIERGRWKGIYISKIPVLDEPLDGIAKFPERYY